MTPETPFALSERHSSSDSNKASSGEVSPYDNNSPVLSDRLLQQHPGDASPRVDRLFRVPEQYTLVGHVKGRTKDNAPAQWGGKGERRRPIKTAPQKKKTSVSTDSQSQRPPKKKKKNASPWTKIRDASLGFINVYWPLIVLIKNITNTG